MNELTTLTDAELDKEIEDLKEREASLHTESGRKYIVGKMRELIGLLETWGYKFDGNEKGLAVLWANAMMDDFVRLGFLGMKTAVTKWAEEDTSQYHIFPKVAWIKYACTQMGGDPRVEKGRRMQEAAERKLEEDHKKQMEHFMKTHPREAARIDAIAARMAEAQRIGKAMEEEA